MKWRIFGFAIAGAALLGHAFLAVHVYKGRSNRDDPRGWTQPHAWIFGPAALLKTVLYLGRRRSDPSPWMWLRVGLGIAVPTAVWAWAVHEPSAASWMQAALAGLLIGEFIDRCEFYTELEPPSPRRQVAIDLAARLRELG